MSKPDWTRERLLQNTLLRYVADRLAKLWFGMDTRANQWVESPGCQWQGNFIEGFSSWRGNDGNQFFVSWNKNTFLVAVSITECDRMYSEDEESWEWDQEKDPDGRTRGLQFLGDVPAEIMTLYKKILMQSDTEFITAGFYGVGDQIFFHDQWEIAADNGLDYFAEYDLPLEKFLAGKPDIGSLKRLFSFEGPLEKAADLAVKLTLEIINNQDLLTEEDKKFMYSKAKFSSMSFQPKAKSVELYRARLEKIRADVAAI